MPSEQQQYEHASKSLLALSGYEGANSSSRRGWVYWPTMDRKRELDSYSSRELNKKGRWLCANMGFPNRCTRGLAEKIGYLIPLTISGDERYDQVVDEHWEEHASQPDIMDAAGQYDTRALQVELNTSAFVDGDVLPVIVRDGDRIQYAVYEAPQIVNPSQTDDSWIDGVRINQFRRHLAYGLSDGHSHQVINARDALYYSHPDALGRVRTPTILKHAINHLIDISEILADVKLTIKVAAQMGFYLKNDKANPGGQAGPRSLASDLRNEQIDAPVNPGSPSVEYKVEDFYRSMGGVPNLPDGTDIGTLQDARPHPNQIALIAHLVRDISWGIGVAPEVLWDITALGGVTARLANGDLDRWIGMKLLRQRAWLQKFRAIWLANEIESGRLEEPPAGAKFWKATYLPQASLTADIGRVGNLNIELIKNRMRTFADHFGEQGKDWQSELRQISKERKFLKELGIELAEPVPRPAAA